MTDDYPRPSFEEIAFGPTGACPRTAPPPASARAREALEDVVERALRLAPAFVSFSGGRDSSAVLAVATHVARRAGLADPRPITLRYPGDSDSDESNWQELVLAHLGIDSPIIIEVTTPATYLDDVVQHHLRTRGLFWPPALQLDDPVLRAAEGGVLFTGEGGDEILGTRRITPLTLLLKMRRRPNRALLRWTVESLEPRVFTRRRVKRRLENTPMWRWLTSRGRRELVRRTVHNDARPFHWGRETIDMLSYRVPNLLGEVYQRVADDHRVTLVHPLQSAEFLTALATQGGRWGYAGRTHLMRELFSDLLPDELLARSTKAHFGGVRWGEPEREFARRWDGSGVPTDLIDVDALRSEWLSERPAGSSALALHAAWLHSNGLSPQGEVR